jgi:hypothetical protein
MSRALLATSNGMIVDGGVYWLDRIAETEMQAYYKNSFPTQGMRVMVTGIDSPFTGSSYRVRPWTSRCGSSLRCPTPLRLCGW